MAGGTNYRVFEPEVWSSFVKVYFKNRLFAAKYFMDFSSDLVGGGEAITIPNLTQGPSATTLTTTTGAITDFIVVETRTQITLNTWKSASKKFSDFDIARIADKYNLQEMYLRNDIAYTLAADLDTALIGKDGAASNIQLHTGTSVVQINNTAIRESIRICESYSVPLQDVAFFFHPNAYWGEMMKRTDLVDASQYGKPVVSSTEIYPVAWLYGIPVYVTQQVGVCTGVGGDGYPQTSHRNLLVPKRAIVFACANLDGTGVGPRLQRQNVADALAMRVVGDIAYGTGTPGKFEGVRIISDT